KPLATHVASYAMSSRTTATYKFRGELPGFKAYEQSQVVIAAATTVRVDAKLEIGQISESVEVTSSAARLQTENSKISASVSNKMVDELPLVVSSAVRSPFDLALITP